MSQLKHTPKQRHITTYNAYQLYVHVHDIYMYYDIYMYNDMVYMYYYYYYYLLLFIILLAIT